MSNNYIVPINNIKRLEVYNHSIVITYDDNTKRTLKKDNNTIIFEKDYINPNNSPIVDHCL
jgi:hypothetical protein